MFIARQGRKWLVGFWVGFRLPGAIFLIWVLILLACLQPRGTSSQAERHHAAPIPLHNPAVHP